MFFGGEQFAITRRFAERALSDYDRDTVFREYFRTTFSPAEMFWQTILYNSKFRPGRFDWNDAHVSDLSKLTPLYFLRYLKQIEVMELKDLDELLNSGRLFFRKAVSGISEDLITSLEQSRQTKESTKGTDFHNGSRREAGSLAQTLRIFLRFLHSVRTSGFAFRFLQFLG